MGTFGNTFGYLSRGNFSDPLQSIKSLMAFWSDGSVVGGQLLDLSGNNRHGTVSDNILSDPSAELGTVLSPWSTALSINENTNSDFHSGTRSWHVLTNLSNGVFTPNRFRTVTGEVYNYSFWIKKTTSGSLNLYVGKGNLSGFSVNTVITPTLNTWVNISGSFTETGGGKSAYIALVSAGSNIDFYLDDLSVTVSGKTGIGITMPNSPILKSIDSNNHFYNSLGIPVTFRSDVGGRGFYNRSIFAKNAKSYIWTLNTPSFFTKYTIDSNFTDPNFIFDSCENVVTVGGGKMYANIQAAMTAIGNSKTFDDKYRIDVYDDFISNIGGTYITSVNYAYINGVGSRKSIHCELPPSSSDAQVVSSEGYISLYNNGARNIDLSIKNGRYPLHIDSIANTNSFNVFYKCSFYHYSNQEVINYRIANSQTYSSLYRGLDAVGSGAYNNQTTNFINCEFFGIKPFFWHSNAAVTSVKSIMELYRCSINSLPIFHTISNPNSDMLENVYLQKSTAVVQSEFRLIENTYNSTISLDGSIIQPVEQVTNYEDMIITVKI